MSVVVSSLDEDMKYHPDTLCDSIAHFVSMEDGSSDSDTTAPPELLYVNGKALLNPLPLSTEELQHGSLNNWYNADPSHVIPRQPRHANDVLSASQYRKFPQECLVGFGFTPLPTHFQKRLLQRRLVFMALEAKLNS